MGGVKCFFSGVESKMHFNACVQAGVSYVLTSYFQFYDKGNKDIVRQRKKAHPNMNFMVDSGAHSFIADWMKFKGWSRQAFEDYVKGYVDWIRANKDCIFAVVEFDIDFTLNMIFGGGPNSTVGASMVEAWQQRYFMPLQEEGIDVIYVWHTERKMEGWEDMCAKFPYVGLPGEMSSNPDFNKFMAVARRYTTKVHGFAATKQADFRDFDWFSVDSITWKTSEMYGALIDWDPHKQVLSFDQDKSHRAAYRRKFESLGLDADGIINDTNYKEVTKYALISMTAMERFYADKFRSRMFYYELRLPHPEVCLRMGPKTTARWWKKFRPDTLFKENVLEQDHHKIRYFLAALSAVQYGLLPFVSAHISCQKFLEHYYPKLMFPQMADPRVFQRELANYVRPPNPPALPRVSREHWEAGNNPPKRRDRAEISLADLEEDPFQVPFSLAEI